jgi:hypothetical protein
MTIRKQLAAFAFAALTPAILLAQAEPASRANSDAAPDWTPRNTFERSADYTRDALPQIRAHLDRVVDELRARDVATLDAAQRAQRSLHIERLASYSAAGLFPTNERLSVPTPIFIDADGRACAVAYLMIESGARELAERVAALENTDYVPDIDEPGVTAWIAASGLTADECAEIQPAYGPCGAHAGMIHSVDLCNPAVRNSSGWPASILACGSVSVSMNQVWFPIHLLPANTTGLMLNALRPASAWTPAGSQGNLCLAGSIGRYTANVFMTDSLGNSGLVIDLTQTPTPHGAVSIAAGETWYFQCWFRDGASSNFSNAVGIVFQ